MNTKTFKAVACALMLAAGTIASQPSAFAHGDPPDNNFKLQKLLADVRKATSPYTDLGAAVAAGYVKFPRLVRRLRRAAGTGRNGHSLLERRVARCGARSDAARNARLPEIRTGKHELVALEYVVFAPVWDALHPQPPVLFGHPLHLVRTPNRYGTAMPLYELHVWLWESNQNGLFNDWNPSVECD
jgi:hypothetical protein